MGKRVAGSILGNSRGLPSSVTTLVGIHHADSVSNLDVAFGMLQGCVIPRDAQAVEGLTEDLTDEIAQALFSVSFTVALHSIPRWLGIHTCNIFNTALAGWCPSSCC